MNIARKTVGDGDQTHNLLAQKQVGSICYYFTTPRNTIRIIECLSLFIVLISLLDDRNNFLRPNFDHHTPSVTFAIVARLDSYPRSAATYLVAYSRMIGIRIRLGHDYHKHSDKSIPGVLFQFFHIPIQLSIGLQDRMPATTVVRLLISL